jgi:hypothetical protein
MARLRSLSGLLFSSLLAFACGLDEEGGLFGSSGDASQAGQSGSAGAAAGSGAMPGGAAGATGGTAGAAAESAGGDAGATGGAGGEAASGGIGGQAGSAGSGAAAGAAGSGGAPLDCTALYQGKPGVTAVCPMSSLTQCKLAFSPSSRSCTQICQAGGGTCQVVHDNASGTTCTTVSSTTSCGNSSWNSAICFCSHG